MGWPLPAPEGGVLERRREGRVATTVRVPAGLGCAPFEAGWATGQWGPAQRQTKRHPGHGGPIRAPWRLPGGVGQPVTSLRRGRQRAPSVLPTCWRTGFACSQGKTGVICYRGHATF